VAVAGVVGERGAHVQHVGGLPRVVGLGADEGVSGGLLVIGRQRLGGAVPRDGGQVGHVEPVARALVHGTAGDEGVALAVEDEELVDVVHERLLVAMLLDTAGRVAQRRVEARARLVGVPHGQRGRRQLQDLVDGAHVQVAGLGVHDHVVDPKGGAGVAGRILRQDLAGSWRRHPPGPRGAQDEGRDDHEQRLPQRLDHCGGRASG